MRYRNGIRYAILSHLGLALAQALQGLLVVVVLAIMAAILGASTGCGRAIPLSTEGLLGDAVITGTGGSRVDGADIGSIYNVTTVIAATQGNPFATTAELPFTGPVRAFGNTTANSQWPFYFTYSYPPNNYKLAEAHLVMDVTRDNSETEGIFVDGVFSGRPVASNQANTATAQITGHIYEGNAQGQSANMYFSTFPLDHYRHSTRNSFDLLIDKLLESTPSLPSTALDLVKDGRLNVVAGDDAAVYSASLVMKGYTISKAPLTCVNSSTFSFQNVFVHNDGNTISQAAFSGAVVGPYASGQAAATGFRSTEWNYDAKLPQVKTANITITSATIGSSATNNSLFRVKRDTSVSPKAAIVINGIGIAETGFDKTLATSAVESWESGSAVTYWESWVQAIPDTGGMQTVTLDLVAMLGASKVRALLAQGKLNIALAGSVFEVFADGASTSRAFTPAVVVVRGPDLALQGTYYTELCEIPFDAASPLTDSGGLPADAGDHVSPVVNSVQATEITSSGAVIQWLTNEGATSQVSYGIGNTSSLSYSDSAYQTFHSITLTGLQAYKVYTFRVITADANGNTTTSGSKTFQTLR
jgi:hypothetical protein